MAVRLTFHCPHCLQDINAQHWLPPLSHEHECTDCGTLVERSNASIRDAWWLRTAYYLYPLASLVFMFLAREEHPLMAILLGLMCGVFALPVLGIGGWIVGALIAANPAGRSPLRDDLA